MLGVEINAEPGNQVEAGDHCELAEGCQRTTKVGPEEVGYIVGKAYRRMMLRNTGVCCVVVFQPL
jgi:hypothetical protein